MKLDTAQAAAEAASKVAKKENENKPDADKDVLSLKQVEDAVKNPEKYGLTEKDVSSLKSLMGDDYGKALLDAADSIDGRQDQLFNYKDAQDFGKVVEAGRQARAVLDANLARIDGNGDKKVSAEELHSAINAGLKGGDEASDNVLHSLAASLDPLLAGQVPPVFHMADVADGAPDGQIDVPALSQIETYAQGLTGQPAPQALVSPAPAAPQQQPAQGGGQGGGASSGQGGQQLQDQAQQQAGEQTAREVQPATEASADPQTAAKQKVVDAAQVMLADNAELDVAYKGAVINQKGISDGQISWSDLNSRIESLSGGSELKGALEGIDRDTFDVLRGDNRYVQVADLKALVSQVAGGGEGVAAGAAASASASASGPTNPPADDSDSAAADAGAEPAGAGPSDEGSGGAASGATGSAAAASAAEGAANANGEQGAQAAGAAQGASGEPSHFLPDITEDDVNNGGVTVSAMLGGAAKDVDAGSSIGVAITGGTSENGRWQYSTDGGASWNDVGDVSDRQSLLLRPEDRVRFSPDGKNGGNPTLTYRGWDQSAGAVGAKVDITSNGGSSAFSVGKDTVGVHVVDVNDAPVLGSVPTQPPVTQPPVTQPPVTQPPVTQPPVTQPPVTQPPVTQPPVTQPPVTQPPVTQPPVTQPPVTQPPVTQPPVTQPPVTQPPVTQPPVTQPPVTQPPVTQPPVTQPPVTQPPVTQPPVTQPPVTQPPVTQPPVTQPPVTQPPVTQPPVTQPPVTQPPVTQPPVTEPPVTQPPVTQPPVTQPPVTQPPVTQPPVTQPPVTQPPVTQPPVTEPPVTEPPVTEPPVTQPPVTEPPVTEPPVTQPPVTQPPVTQPPVTQPPAEGTPTTDPMQLSVGVARGALLPYRNYFDGLAKQTMGAQYIPGVVNLDVLNKAVELQQLPQEALDRLKAFLAPPDAANPDSAASDGAYYKLRDQYLPPSYSNGEDRQQGIYLDALQSWTETRGTMDAPGPVRMVDAAGSQPGMDSLADLYDKSRGTALTGSNETQARNQRLEDVVSTLLRHRDLLGATGPDGTPPHGQMITKADVDNLLKQHGDKLTAEEQKALSMFSQDDFYFLMKSAGSYAEPGVTDPTELERALQNGKLSVDWMEAWLFVNNEDQRTTQATMDDYVKVAGAPALNQPDMSYQGTDIYDV